QILCITCDNASSNTVMVDTLSGELPNYGGRAGHARCFLHTTNLVAKCLLRAFDVKRGNRLADVELTGEEIRMFREMDEMAEAELEDDVGDDAVDDNLEGLVDEIDQLSPEERKELRTSIRPVQLALAKASVTSAILISPYNPSTTLFATLLILHFRSPLLSHKARYYPTILILRLRAPDLYMSRVMFASWPLSYTCTHSYAYPPVTTQLMFASCYPVEPAYILV
ncbi:hypothetical protein L210DRAFT_3415341, partial [Boletus edulis BED1]